MTQHQRCVPQHDVCAHGRRDGDRIGTLIAELMGVFTRGIACPVVPRSMYRAGPSLAAGRRALRG